jgi:hypothetical protein
MAYRTLAEIALRIQGGTTPVIAIKEFVDDWNRHRDVAQVAEEPVWVQGDDQLWVNYWLAGAAEYGAFLTDQETPLWANQECYFSRMPIVHGGPNMRRYALVETPFAWRRRLLFMGQATMLAA